MGQHEPEDDQAGRRSDDDTDRDKSESGDADSTTGTGHSETAVGRVEGQDEGYLETGAEKRAEVEDEQNG